MYFSRLLVFLAVLFAFGGCGDNLVPSSSDRRPSVQAGSSGGAVSQSVPSFSVSDILGAPVTPAAATAGSKGAVFYFTMWCPVCDSHMSSFRTTVMPDFPGVRYYLVDYVSGSVAAAGDAARASGYGGGDFGVLADVDNTLERLFAATMGTTVVLDAAGVVRMNEDYKDGVKLRSVLAALP